MSYRDDFSKRLIYLRKLKKMTLQNLGDVLKITPQAVNKMEKGLRSPSFETLCAVVDFFGVSFDYLLGRTNETYSDARKRKIQQECVKIFSERLSDLRFQNDFTLQQIGDAIGTSRNEVIALEKGEKVPTISQVRAIANLFSVPFEYLLTDDDTFNDIEDEDYAETEKELRILYDRLLNPEWDFQKRMERDEKGEDS